MLPDARQIAGGGDRIGREAVDLGLVEEQEERARATDAVVGIVTVEPRVGDTARVQRGDAELRTVAQLVENTERDRIRRARLRARRLHSDAQAVVTERALPGAAVVLALVDHAVGTGRDAVTAPVANVLLHDDRTELGAEQRSGRADVEARSVRAVLADVAGHQPTHFRRLTGLLLRERLLLLDE